MKIIITLTLFIFFQPFARGNEGQVDTHMVELTMIKGRFIAYELDDAFNKYNRDNPGGVYSDYDPRGEFIETNIELLDKTNVQEVVKIERMINAYLNDICKRHEFDCKDLNHDIRRVQIDPPAHAEILEESEN